MGVEAKSFGVTKNSEEAHLFVLTNKKGSSIAVTDFGATLVQVNMPDKDGHLADVVLGYDDVNGYEVVSGHLGATVGRNANRIANGRFTLNGKEYVLTQNNGTNNLHSGMNYYSQRIWESECGECPEGYYATFYLESPDGDQGYPGNAKIFVTYTLTEEDAVWISYHGVADADTAFNMTNHSYFNLAGEGSGDILNHLVWLDSDEFTIADEGSIPTGELVKVAGTPMDFTEEKAVGRDIEADYAPLHMAKGYDHNWVLKNNGQLACVATCRETGSGRIMEVYTDLPGIQIYTGNGLHTNGKGGHYYDKRDGICFETQYYPNSINTPHFPQPVVKAGEEYKTKTVFRFGVEE